MNWDRLPRAEQVTIPVTDLTLQDPADRCASATCPVQIAVLSATASRHVSQVRRGGAGLLPICLVAASPVRFDQCQLTADHVRAFRDRRRPAMGWLTAP